MKKIEDILKIEKQKVIKNLIIKKNICNGILVSSIVLTGLKGISTVHFIENIENEQPTTKDYVQEIVLDVIPITGITVSCLKRKQYIKDLKQIRK